MVGVIRSEIEALAADNRSGATALAERAAGILAEAAGTPGADLPAIALAVARAQPAMAPLLRVANCALLAAGAQPADPAGAVRQAADAFVAGLREHAREASRRAAALLDGKVRALTHSASSVVADAILQAHAAGARLQVTCTESRPALEGVALAQRLGAAGVAVRLVIHAAGPALLPECDLLLFGADTICCDGVLHKVGTLGLAVAARHHGIPAYALATDEKLLPAGCGPRPPIPERDPKELLPAPAPGVTPINFYFDLTPRRCFAGIVTEQGILTDAALVRRLEEIPVVPALAGIWG